MNKKMETRALANSIREIKAEEGIVDAYLTAWGTVDSYKTTFQRGSFSKTFENRANKIRLLWNHDELAGKVLECKEDDYGPFVRVQFNLETEVGRTAFAHCRAGDVDAFSFGFNVINEKWDNGIRTFTEVKVLECSPVLFPANEAAVITQVREEVQEQETEYKNDLQKVVREQITKEIVEKTTLTIDDYRRLDTGRLLTVENRHKLAELSTEIRDAHQREHRKAVESLCNELREGGFTPAEKTRFIALLGVDTEQPEEIDNTINFIKQFRKNLRG